MYAGCVFGAAIGGTLCDYLGRKMTVFVVSIIFVVGAIIVSTAPNLGALFVGRFVIGVGVAISAIVDVTYLTEIAPPQYRGSVVSTNEFMISVGFLVAFLIDFAFSSLNDGWRYMLAFPGILAILWAACMYYMPESPRWLLVKFRDEEALKVFAMIYDTSEEAAREKHKAKKSVDALRTASSSTTWQIISQWKLPVFVSISLMILQNFSGNAGILAYAPEFFQFAGYGSNASTVATITLGFIKVISTGFSLYFVDYFGRRPLLLSGITGMTFALVVMAILFANMSISSSTDDGNSNNLSSASSSAVLFLVCVYIASYGIGYGPVTWLIASEFFSDEIRGRTLGLATVANWLATLIVVGSFLTSVDAIGLSYTLVVYAVDIICKLVVLPRRDPCRESVALLSLSVLA